MRTMAGGRAAGGSLRESAEKAAGETQTSADSGRLYKTVAQIRLIVVIYDLSDLQARSCADSK